MAEPRLTPVDFDPFARGAPRLTAVDYDPFAASPQPASQAQRLAGAALGGLGANAPDVSPDMSMGEDFARRRAELRAQVEAGRDESAQIVRMEGRPGAHAGQIPIYETQEQVSARLMAARTAQQMLDRETPDDPYAIDSRLGNDRETRRLIERLPTGPEASRERMPGLYRGRERLTQREIVNTIIDNRERVRGLNPNAAFTYLFGGPAARTQIDNMRRPEDYFAGGGPRTIDETVRDRSRNPSLSEGPTGDTVTPGDVENTPRYRDFSAQAQEAQRRAREIARIRRQRERDGYYDGLGGFLRGWGEAGVSTVMQTAGSVVGSVMDNLGLGDTRLGRAARVSREVGGARMELADPGYQDGSLPYYLFHGGVAIEQMAGALAVGATTRNPLAMTSGIMGVQVAAQEYDDLRQKGYNPRAALAVSLLYGLAEAIPERIALGRILHNNQRFGQSLLRRTVVGGGAAAFTEGFQEDFTEALQIGIDTGILNEQMTWGEAWRRMRDSGIIGAMTGAPIGAVHAGVSGSRRAEREANAPEVDQAARDLLNPDNGTVPSNVRPLETRRAEPVERMSRADMVPRLQAMVDDPDTPADQRERAASYLDQFERTDTKPDNVTQEDIDSPIPTDLISEGKAQIDEAIGRTAPAGPQRSRTEPSGQPARFVDSFSRFPHSAAGQGPGAPRPYRNGTHAGNARDFAMPVGTPLLAEMDWRLVASPRPRDRGLTHNTDRQGTWFAVEYADGSRHIFRHVSAIPEHTSGRAGEVMGVSGNTGINSSGPHTHRESWVLGANGELTGIDPARWLENARAGRNGAVVDVAAGEVDSTATPPEQADTSWINAPVDQPESVATPAATAETRLPAETVEVNGAPATVQERFDLNGEPGVRLALADGTTVEDTVARLAARGVQIGPVSQPVIRTPTPTRTTEAAPARDYDALWNGMRDGSLTRQNVTDSGIDPLRFDALVMPAYQRGEINSAADMRSFVEQSDQRPAGIAPQQEAEAGVAAQPAPEIVAPAASQGFNPDTHIEGLRDIVAKGGSLDLKAIGRALGIKPKQAEQVAVLLSTMPNSGIARSRKGKLKGKFRREAVVRGPVSAIRFLRSIGGIRDDGGHELMKGRNWHTQAPGLIQRNGRSLDEVGEALLDAGYFHNRNSEDRPTVAEVIDFIENAMRTPAYRQDDLAEVQARDAKKGSKKARTDAEYAVRDIVETLKLNLAPEELAGAVDYMGAGDSAEVALQRALNDANATYLYESADQSGRDFYETVAGRIYEGDIAESRGSDEGAQDGSVGPEAVAGEPSERAPPAGQSEEDGGGKGVTDLLGQPVEQPKPTGTEKPAQPETPDMFGTREGDERRALERAGEGRLKSDKKQKAPGEDGGLLDTRDTTRDIEDVTRSESPADYQTLKAQGLALGAEAADPNAFAIGYANGRVGERGQAMARGMPKGQRNSYFDGNDLGAKAKDDPALAAEHAAMTSETAPATDPVEQAKAVLQNALDALNGQTPQPTANERPTASWVIRNRETGEVVMETFDRKKVDALNTEKYEAVPIQEYLAGLNKPKEAAAAEPQPEQPMFQRRLTEGDDPIFYSALERAVAANPTARASAAQWAATLSKAAGVKREELEWTGLFDWLDMQEGPVSRDDLLGVIRDGGIKVEEVVLGDPAKKQQGSEFFIPEVDRAFRGARDRDEAIMQLSNDSAAYYALQQRRPKLFEKDGDYNEDWAADVVDDIFPDGFAGQPQFANWSSDQNNDSYRELLITLPIAQGGNPERAPSTHWDQEAVVAHARFMPKTDADGKRVLFVEEVQSDWHQKGRDEGYQRDLSEEELATRDAARDEAEDAFKAAARELESIVLGAGRGLPGNTGGETVEAANRLALHQIRDASQIDGFNEADERLAAARLRYIETQRDASRRAEGSIPNAPFKASWPALVLKRMVRWAADNGFDKIAWTTGAEQNERYSLEKHIDRVVFMDNSSGGIGRADMEGPTTRGTLRAYGKNGERLVNEYVDLTQNPNAIADYIGPELASRLLDTEPHEGADAGLNMRIRNLSGVDLKTGGEGMRGFYDRNLVNIANDLIKKYGGKVEPVALTDKEAVSSAGKTVADYETELARAQEMLADPDLASWEKERWETQATATADRLFALKNALKNPGFTITESLADAARSGFPLFARQQAARGAPTDAQVSAIAERLQSEMARLGIEDRIALQVANGLLKDVGDGSAQGAYFRRVIKIATDMALDPEATFHHESLHAIRALGLFNESEWTALVKQATADADLMAAVNRQYRDLSQDKRQEEAVAEFYSRWRTERSQAKGFAAKAFQRLLDFVHALGRAIGYVRGQPEGAGTVMRRIESGKVGRRETGSAQTEMAPQFQKGSPIAFENEATEKRWQEARKGVGAGVSIITKGKAAWDSVVAGMTRHWKYLPNSPRFVNVREQFRKLEAAPEFAKEETVRHLNDVVGKLTAAEYDLFTRKVVLDDLDYEAGREHALPFGLTPETLKAERARINDAVDASPKIQEAIDKRLARNRKIADEMVKEEILDEASAANPAYFRHMVLDYARAERQMARGAGSKVMSPWWAKRAGSSLDINANFLEAEADWMLKAMVDIETAKTIRYIKESDHNLREDLRKQARDMNKQGIDEAIAKSNELGVQEAEFRKRVAMGLDDVRKAVESGDLDPPAQFRDAADSLTSKSPRDESIFPFLSWIMENGKPGMRGAAMALKAISNRRAWARDILGNRYINPENMQELVKKLAPEGYVGWQPREGRHLFTAKTIPEHVIDRLIANLADNSAFGIGKDEMARALESIKPQLVVGGDRYTMVIPKEIADTLDEFGDVAAESMFAKIFAGVQGAWKRWVLINPRRFLKYNLNNQMGDLDAVIAGHPATMRKVPQAAKELYQVMRNGAEPSTTYREAQERGVFTSGLTIQEIPDINRLSSLKHLTSDVMSNRPDKLLARGVGKVWRTLQGTTQYRESIFRYAAYLSLKEKMDAGQTSAQIGYGASVPKLIDAVTDNADRAALMARDLLGDYGAISAVGGWLRKYLIPFYSWLEINTRRYARVIPNIYRTSRAKGRGKGAALGTAVFSYSAASLTIRMAGIYGLIQLWNHLLFPDEEDELGELQKRQLHLIIGRDSDGQVISLRTQGALSDFLNTFGFEDAMAAFRRADVGQGDYSEMLGAVAKAPLNRIATSVTPLIGEPIEQALGLELWPDAFNPRPIRDRLRHLASTFSLENEYDVVADRPSRGYWRSWADAVVYRRDPGEMAYDDIRGVAARWLERTRGESGSVNRRSPKSDALRDYRQALRFGDQDAAQEALARYRQFDGTRRGLQQSIRSAAPLGMIPRRLRRQFRASLTPDQLENLNEAQEFYDRVYIENH